MTGLFIMIIVIFMWSGFICAISFMESWLKFRASGITVHVGLSIGKLVFGVLNKVEWTLAVIIAISMLADRTVMTSLGPMWFALILVILFAQTAWLLPGLNKRATIIISGKTLPASMLHWYYVIAEIVKLLSLFILGISFLKLIIQLRQINSLY